jgi:dihydroorotate dehydrogenase
LYNFLRPLLFKLSAEKAHYLAMDLLKTGLAIPGVSQSLRANYQLKDQKLERELFGIKFPNPVGIAAGFDKDARFYNELSAIGFGFIEVGTITPQPQDGNPQPRLFRLPLDKALINRMGFNNQGLEAAIERLRDRDKSIIIGGNIGKNKNTPNEQAVNDYNRCFNGLFNYVDYFVVNVSSPNTPGLRELQEKGPLLNILNTLQTLNSTKAKRKPILLKIAPDLTDSQLDDIIDIVKQSKIDGLIATNTTISRDGLTTSAEEIEKTGAGGLSGLPLRKRATEVIRYIHQQSGGTIPIIGVGGIMNPEDAIEKLNAGAALVQLYTGFIYYGPTLVRDINRAIATNL